MKLKKICLRLYGNKSKAFLARWSEKLGAVTKYYLVNTFVDPIHSRFRYTKIIYNKENCLSYMRRRIF